MNIKVGDKIGTFIITEVFNNNNGTFNVTGKCTICNETYTLENVNNDKIAKSFFTSISCGGQDINYNLYVGKKIGSFIITKYKTSTGFDGTLLIDAEAKCYICGAVAEIMNFSSTKEIVQGLLAYSCKEPDVAIKDLDFSSMEKI